MSRHTYWDSVFDRLKEIERDRTPQVQSGNTITPEHRGTPIVVSGILTTKSNFDSTIIGGIMHARHRAEVKKLLEI